MKKIILGILITTAVTLLLNCAKKNQEEQTTSTNIATQVVSNLSSVSSSYSPDSLATTTARFLKARSGDPCAGVTDFAICQSNLIRAYNQLGKDVVDAVSQIVNSVGSSLGQVPDGNSGTSQDGLISWNRTNSENWSVLARGTGSQTSAYISIASNVYTLKIDQSVATSDPKNQQMEVVISFTSSNEWTVDVFFSNTDCDSSDVGSPSKAQLRVALSNNLWTGKAMLYTPRWKAPGATITCATAAGTSEIALYTDYVGNDTSTKASLYMLPASNNNLAAIGNFDLNDFCTNFAASCGGMGQPTAGFLAAYPNPWCTTGPNTSPTWGNACTANPTVNAASYSSATNWIVPSSLKVKTVTMPTSL